MPPVFMPQNSTATTGPVGTNMVLVASYTYDADGNLIESRSYFGSGASDYYATEYHYDYRGRQTDVFAARQASALTAPRVVTHYEYDNLGRVLWTKTYASSDFAVDDDELRSQVQNFYDNLGRVYETWTYEVNPTSGADTDHLASETWYDARGQVVKTATSNGLFQKFAYNGLGQVVASYTCYDTDETAYADAANVIDDTVIEETRYWYDQAGETIATATYSRLPNDTSTTGELTAANSYATASVMWYDGLGRQVAAANYGREDTGSSLAHYFFDGTSGALVDANANGIPDVAESARPQTFAESSSSQAGIDFQLQLTQYDTAGRAYRTIDNLGRINQTDYDDAGRVIRTIQNYQNGTVEETDTQQDITVEYQYDYRGRLATMTAYNAKGSGGGVQEQATKYLYDDSSTAINHSWQTGVIYPDSADELSQNSSGFWSITTNHGDHTSTQYDRLGRITATTDQRGVVHAYTYDSAGRKSADMVTSLGATGIVDDSVLAIVTTYDDIGRVQSVTSYSDTSGTAPVNEVKYEYNGWGKVYREYQEHDGAVDVNSLFVQYDYADGATDGVAKYVRLEQVTYPNGREVHYDYGTAGAIDDIMSRLATIGDGASPQAAYSYLGADKIVTEDYVEAQVKLDYAHDNLAGFDRFGRAVDQLWTDYGSDPDVTLDHYTYTYDRAGNRTSRTNVLNDDLSEAYDYNGLDELISTIRNDNFDQSWNLDGLGNWLEFDDDGTAQTRDVNGANEITSTTGMATPTYDRVGNMTSVPKSTDLANTLGLKYDAWNRLVEVTDGGILLAKFSYDGTGRRIEQATESVDGQPQQATHNFHSEQQVIETREGLLTASPESLAAKYQNVWSPRYIDSLVLRDTYSSGVIQPASRLYYLADANYNVTAVVTSEGQAVERYAYSAYGEATIYTPDWSATRAVSLVDNTTLYTGRELDLATGLYYYRARYCSPELGRFISRDPIQSDLNLYRYVTNNPLIFTDPTGLIGRFVGPTCDVCMGPYSQCQFRASMMYTACLGGTTLTAVLELVGCAGLCSWAGLTGFGYAACVSACTSGLTATSILLTLPHCDLALQQAEMKCGNQYNQCAFKEHGCGCGPGNENWRP